MDRLAVESSAMLSIGYDDGSETLELEFKGGVYQYLNVPRSIYEQLVEAPSKGSFFNVYIRPTYPAVRI